MFSNLHLEKSFRYLRNLQGSSCGTLSEVEDISDGKIYTLLTICLPEDGFNQNQEQKLLALQAFMFSSEYFLTPLTFSLEDGKLLAFTQFHAQYQLSKHLPFGFNEANVIFKALLDKLEVAERHHIRLGRFLPFNIFVTDVSVLMNSLSVVDAIFSLEEQNDLAQVACLVIEIITGILVYRNSQNSFWQAEINLESPSLRILLEDILEGKLSSARQAIEAWQLGLLVNTGSEITKDCDDTLFSRISCLEDTFDSSMQIKLENLNPKINGAALTAYSNHNSTEDLVALPISKSSTLDFIRHDGLISNNNAFSGASDARLIKVILLLIILFGLIILFATNNSNIKPDLVSKTAREVGDPNELLNSSQHSRNEALKIRNAKLENAVNDFSNARLFCELDNVKYRFLSLSNESKQSNDKYFIGRLSVYMSEVQKRITRLKQPGKAEYWEDCAEGIGFQEYDKYNWVYGGAYSGSLFIVAKKTCKTPYIDIDYFSDRANASKIYSQIVRFLPDPITGISDHIPFGIPASVTPRQGSFTYKFNVHCNES